MNKKKTVLLTVMLVIVIVSAATVSWWVNESAKSSRTIIRVACVGDSLTQSTAYPFILWMKLGKTNYTLENFGVGSTTVLLNTETPYMNTTAYQNVLKFQPDIVIIMLGTNDAQPNLERYNASFVADYVKLVSSFKVLPSHPKIWLVLPPHILGNQSGTIDPQYFSSTIIPAIKQVANETNLPTIDVYSALTSPIYFKDDIHINDEGAKLVAEEVYKAITSQNATATTPND